MSFRTTALLFGILIGVLWLFGLMLTLQRNKLDPGLVLPTLAREKKPDINKVEIEQGTKKLTFVKGDAGWELTIPPHSQKLRADDGSVQAVIRALTELKKKETPDITQNPGQWGLTNPSQKITLTSKAGKVWTLNIGKTSPDGSYVYVNSTPDRPDTVLAVLRRDIKDALVKPEEVNKFRSQQLLDASDFNTRWVDLRPGASAKGRELVLEKGKDGGWRFVKPPYGIADYEGNPGSTDPTGVRGLLNTLGAIRVEKESDFEPLDRAPFPEDKALLAVEVERTAEGDKKGGKETLLIGEKANKDQYYARLKNDQVVVRVGARNVDLLLDFARKPDSLRSRDVALFDKTKADVVQLSSGKGLGEVVTLYRPPLGGWRVAAGGLRHRADADAVGGEAPLPDKKDLFGKTDKDRKGLLAAVQGKGEVKDFFDVADEAKEGKAMDEKLGLTNPTAKVAVWVGGLEPEKAPEKDKKAAKEEAKKGEKGEKGEKQEAAKDGKAGDTETQGPRIKSDVKPVVTLLFGKTVGDLVYLKRQGAEGSVSRVSVPVSLLDRLTPREGALAFLDKNISPFTDSAVEKLELKVGDGKQVFVVQREAEKDKKEKDKAKKDEEERSGGWVLLQKGAKGQTPADAEGVRDALSVLTHLTVERYVARVGPKDDLDRPYGLKTPRVEAVVTLKKKEGQKETTFTYQFGSKEPEEKGKTAGIFARMTSGDLKDIVFVVPTHEAKKLEEAELRDRTVIRFDPAKVNEVKVTVKEKSFEVDLDFERKGGVWEVKKGPRGFKLNPSRVGSLVRDLSALRAVRFVSFDGPTEKQGLTGTPKVKIEVVMADKTSHTLALGAPEGADGYYALSGSMPKTVFLVPQARFSGLMADGVSYFSGR
jgi:hypothetical protein